MDIRKGNDKEYTKGWGSFTVWDDRINPLLISLPKALGLEDIEATEWIFRHVNITPAKRRKIIFPDERT